MPRPTLRILCGLLLATSLVPATLLSAPKIGVLLKGRTKFWSVVEQGAVAAGAKAGAEVIVKVPLTESDVAMQIQMLNALGAQGVNAIVLAPTDQDALAGPAAALAAKGIKIVVIDSPLGGTAGSVFIGTDHHAAGAAAGHLLAQLVGDSDEVSIFKHIQGNAATGDREEGAAEVLRQAHPKVVIFGDIYSGNEKSEQIARANFLLAKHPGTKAILASSTPGTLAMLGVLAQRQPVGAIKLVGFGFNLNEDIAAALTAGTLHGWIAQLPGEIGRRGVESALALVAGQSVPAVIHVDVTVVTKDNLGDPAVQALLKL